MTEQDRPLWLTQQTLLVLTIVLALVFVGLIWLASRWLNPEFTAAQPSPSPAGIAADWPTPEPTFPPAATSTPRPTALPPSTPTPIPVPFWQALSDLTIIELTLATDAQAEAPPDKLRGIFGTDQVTLHMVGRVKLGIDLSKIEAIRSGSAITVTLPHVTIQDVVPVPEQSQVRSAKQRWAFSQYQGLELKAEERGRAQLQEMVASNPSFYELAEEVTRYRMETHLRTLGFTSVAFR